MAGRDRFDRSGQAAVDFANGFVEAVHLGRHHRSTWRMIMDFDQNEVGTSSKRVRKIHQMDVGVRGLDGGGELGVEDPLTSMVASHGVAVFRVGAAST